MEDIDKLKKNIREDIVPYFSDEDLQYYLDCNDNDLKKTSYQCLLLKAEDTTLQVSGLTLPDSGKYFRNLATKYRTSNSGILS
jgi:hypothetical protein